MKGPEFFYYKNDFYYMVNETDYNAVVYIICVCECVCYDDIKC